MSEPDDETYLGERLLREPRTAGLRERMESFLSDHDMVDPGVARSDGSDGRPLSEVVIDERDERV